MQPTPCLKVYFQIFIANNLAPCVIVISNFINHGQLLPCLIINCFFKIYSNDNLSLFNNLFLNYHHKKLVICVRYVLNLVLVTT